MRSLQFDGETDEAFRERAGRAATVARLLVAGCLSNHQVQDMIADGSLAEAEVRRSPVVRVEFEQAYAIGEIGETLHATRSKSWGEGPWIMPLEPYDTFFDQRITYVYRESSLYNRRFEQRKRLKELLGKHRPLVELAKTRYITKTIFLRDLTDEQARAIRMILHVEPGEFWRAARGAIFLTLPPRLVQLPLEFPE